MAATGQDAEVYRGATAGLRVTLTNAAGQPLDPATPLHYRVARDPESEAVLSLSPQASSAEGATVAEIRITREQSLALGAGWYYHELYTVDDNGDEDHVLMSGQLTILPAQIALHSP